MSEVEVYWAADSQDAHAVKTLLEEAGIAAHVMDQTIFSADLPSSFASPRVWVAKDDEIRARALVARWQSERSREDVGEDWECSQCGADVSGNFEICWNCQGPRPSGRGRRMESETPATEESVAPEPPRSPGMSRRVTIGLSVLLAACLAATAVLVFLGSGLDALAFPNRTTIHVFERSLDAATAAQELPGWVRWLIYAGTPEEARAEAARAYDEALEAGLDSPGDSSLSAVAAHRRAIGGARQVDDVLQGRLLLFGIVIGALLVAGAIIVLLWVLRGRRWPILGEGRAVAPWSAAEGYAVAVRSAAYGALALFAVYFVVPELWVWSTLVASLPMIWLVRRHLLLPRALGFRAGFGLGAPPAVRTLALTVLAFLMLDLSGERLTTWSAGLAGLGYDWTELFAEELLFGSRTMGLMVSIEAVIWAPLFEEIGFRGLVYPTLRTRLGVLPAALASAVLFSAIHFYSLPGFLALTLSGFLWAILYEKTRSLWPCVVCHALRNLLAVGSVLLLYR